MALAYFIRPAEAPDANAWRRMREALWPDRSDHAGEIAQYFSDRRNASSEVLFACLGSGTPIGFVELSIRHDAEGRSTDRVASVEGWFVDAEYRRQGIGRSLMTAAEEWRRANGAVTLDVRTARPKA